MANYENLKTAVRQVIKPNGNEEITGQIMQQALIAMINSLGKGYQFIGVVLPYTEFTPGDEKIFALAFEPGEYPDFGNAELEGNKFAIFFYDGEWTVLKFDYFTHEFMEGKQDEYDNNIQYDTEFDRHIVNAINRNKQRIDNLFAIGRYLAIWNAATGLPTSNPSGTPYPYKAGDWFLVGIVADEGGTNYMPNGTEYTGEASTTPYVDEVPLKVGDRFFFDGTTWKPLVATYPEDNNVKYDEQTLTDAQKLQARTNIGAQEELFKRGAGQNSMLMIATHPGDNLQNEATGNGSLSIGRAARTAGNASMAMGLQVSTNNRGELAAGNYNLSHKVSTTFGNAKNTLFSIGCGNSSTTRHNAIEIMENGDIYLLGFGGYNGKNSNDDNVLPIQKLILTRIEIRDEFGDVNTVLQVIPNELWSVLPDYNKFRKVDGKIEMKYGGGYWLKLYTPSGTQVTTSMKYGDYPYYYVEII